MSVAKWNKNLALQNAYLLFVHYYLANLLAIKQA